VSHSCFSWTTSACKGLTLCPSSFSLLILSIRSGDRPGQRKWIVTGVLLTVRDDQVRDQLRNLTIYKLMGLEEMHPRVLRELADVVPSHSP